MMNAVQTFLAPTKFRFSICITVLWIQSLIANVQSGFIEKQA